MDQPPPPAILTKLIAGKMVTHAIGSMRERALISVVDAVAQVGS